MSMKPSMSRRELISLAGCAGIAALTKPLMAMTGTPPDLVGNKSAMIKRPIPSTGEQLPVVGIGTWQQFDVDVNDNSRPEKIAALRKMVDMGGTVVDSSPMYGRSEERIGDFAVEAGLASKLFYATKVWTTGEQNGIRQMEESKRKMRREKMDLMQVHNLTDWQTHLKTLDRWKQEGRIRYTGVTHYTDSSHARLEEIVKAKKVDFIQCNYSILERNAERSLLSTAADHGVAVLINQPFESGSLFQKVRGKQLPGWAADYQIRSWAQFFLKFILSNPAVTCVIPGASNPRYVEDNMGAGFGRMPDEVVRKKMIALVEKFG